MVYVTLGLEGRLRSTYKVRSVTNLQVLPIGTSASIVHLGPPALPKNPPLFKWSGYVARKGPRLADRGADLT